MSFHKEVQEGLQSFLAFKNAFKEDPYEKYVNFMIQNSPAGAMKQAGDSAYEQMQGEGTAVGLPDNMKPPGFWQRLGERLGGGTRTGINTTRMPGAIVDNWGGGGYRPPAPWSRTAQTQRFRQGGKVRAYQQGGTIEEEIMRQRIAEEEARRQGEFEGGLAVYPHPTEAPGGLRLGHPEARPMVPSDGGAANAPIPPGSDWRTWSEQRHWDPKYSAPKDTPPIAKTVKTDTVVPIGEGYTAGEVRPPAIQTAPDMTGPDYVPGERSSTSSALGRVIQQGAKAIGVPLTPQAREIDSQWAALDQRRAELTKSIVTQETDEARAAREEELSRVVERMRQLENIRAGRPAVPDQPADATPPAATPTQTPPAPAPATGGTPPAQAAINTSPIPAGVAQPWDDRVPRPTPQGPPDMAPPLVPPGVPQPFDDRMPAKGAPRKPAGGGGGGGGTTVAQGSNDGQARPGGAPGAVPGPGGRKRLRDQTRIEAFDPTLDRDDPDNAGLVLPGGARNTTQYGPPTPEDARAAENHYNAPLAGAVHFARWMTNADDPNHPHQTTGRLGLQSGAGAMPADVAQGVNKAWNEGGRLTPAQALTRYMVYKYHNLVGMGRTDLANQMAFEVVQRLNLESANHADAAVRYIQQGDMQNGLNATQRAHDFSPDGTKLAVSKDGKTMYIVSEFNGNTSRPIQVTPQTLLAMAMGMRDGSGLWDHLAVRARMYLDTRKGADKDAEGRAIRNENNRLRGELLRRKLAGGGGGGRRSGGGGSAAASPAFDDFTTLATGKRPTTTTNVTNVYNQGGGDDTGGPDDVGSRSDDE